ncbi:hypothetical protein F5J12DRAFT_785553 [Pisolithus orientalis]|uniref:uncharacterized protein n=1 Tax=Pisolithus orientalis TaxID=936130 RepID=UPI002225269B|nr:uncharacterized protein F5J12DRAFT_785553 [Pisolithus orientalis]KAI5995784.1 hypothetical protein F5J12DRAFT_785553 [Pisolithus orientalis]
MTLITQYQRFISATTLPKVLRKPTFWVTQMEYCHSGFQLEFHLIFLIHYSNVVFHSWQSTLEDMIGKPKSWHAVQPPKGWEEHMFGLRDRRHSLTPHPSIMNTPMLPSPSLHLDNQIHDEDSAMEEVEENPDNNENEDDQPSSNNNEDDQPSGSKNKDDPPSSSKKEDDWLPGSNDDKETESSSNSHDDDDAHACNAQTISCAQSPLPPSLLPAYKSHDSAHPVGDIVHPQQEGGPIYTRLQKKDKADQNSINNLITKEYNTLMIGIPKDDFAARREKLKAVYEWSESSSTVPTNQSVKSIAARVDNAKTQFSGLVEVWANLEDIEIVGAVMCLRNSDGVDARVANTSSIGDVDSALELCCHTKETPRDCNHRVFRSMMKEKMLAALRDLHVTCGIEVGDPQKVSWHQLLEFLQKSHLTIINWSHGVSPLGPGFEYKKLKAGPLHQLVVPYLQRKLGLLYDRQTDDEEEQDSLDDVLEIEIKCWNKEVINILDADPLKGEITLVKATDGTVLWQISDDPEWQKSLKEMDHQQQGTEVLQQQQLPFPSQKQPCMEASNHDTIGPQDLHQDNLPSCPHVWEAGPAQQSFPRQQDSWGDCTNYRDPGPSNIPYHRFYCQLAFSLGITFWPPQSISSVSPRIPS